MNEISPENNRDYDVAKETSDRQTKLGDMERAAMRSAGINEEDKDVIIESMNERFYPEEILDQVQTTNGKTVLAILGNKSLDNKTLQELEGKVRRLSNLRDEVGNPVMPFEEAVTLMKIINSTTSDIL